MKKQQQPKKDIIDLRRFLEPCMTMADENGSYTGVTRDTALGIRKEQPVQDADDL